MDLLQTACRTALARPSLLARPLLLTRPFSTTLARPADKPSSAPNMNRILSALSSSPESDSSLLKPSTLPPRPPSPTTLASSSQSTLSKGQRMAKEIRGLNNATMKSFDSKEFADEYLGDKKKEIQLWLKPRLGRTVNVRTGQGLEQALGRLSTLVARNKVKQELISRKFYERPALKRKRLRRERKETRFAQGVRAAISRTMKLRQMGW